MLRQLQLLLLLGLISFMASFTHALLRTARRLPLSRAQHAVTHRLRMSSTASPRDTTEPMQQVLFVEVGFGNDQHGQNSVKAAVRACRNAIEFNSIPSIRNIVPGGRDNMKLRIEIACPEPEKVRENLDQVRAVFPYGKFLPIVVKEGGMMASSGIAMAELGDKNDQMHIAIACVTLGY